MTTITNPAPGLWQSRHPQKGMSTENQVGGRVRVPGRTSDPFNISRDEALALSPEERRALDLREGGE